MMRCVTNATSINFIDGKCSVIRKNFNQSHKSISHHVTLLVNYVLGGGHIDRQTDILSLLITFLLTALLG